MSLIADDRAALQAEWRLLQERWAEARARWRDPVAERFEREFWQEYERLLPQVLDQLLTLDETVDQALRRAD